MLRSVSFIVVALALVAGCSGEGDDSNLVGRWIHAVGNEMEFSSDGRVTSSAWGAMSGGSYTARDGILTIEIEKSGIEFPEAPRHQAVPYWTDGDTLQVLFASPDHGGDDIAGTWRREIVMGFAQPDGSVSFEASEVVTDFAADGTVIEQAFNDGIQEEPDTGTYTVTDGAIRFTWERGDNDLVEVRDLRDGRMGGLTYVRPE